MRENIRNKIEEILEANIDLTAIIDTSTLVESLINNISNDYHYEDVDTLEISEIVGTFSINISQDELVVSLMKDADEISGLPENEYLIGGQVYNHTENIVSTFDDTYSLLSLSTSQFDLDYANLLKQVNDYLHQLEEQATLLEDNMVDKIADRIVETNPNVNRIIPLSQSVHKGFSVNYDLSKNSAAFFKYQEVTNELINEFLSDNGDLLGISLVEYPDELCIYIAETQNMKLADVQNSGILLKVDRFFNTTQLMNGEIEHLLSHTINNLSE